MRDSEEHTQENVYSCVKCTCSRKCVAETCPCIKNGLLCTAACTKFHCENYINEEVLKEQNDDESDEDDQDDDFVLL